MLKNQHKILFVDDEPENLVLAQRALSQFHEVLTAASPQDALRLLKEQQISVIVSDQLMPQMKGSEFLAQVRESSPKTIRFLLTGLSESDDIQEAINSDLVYGCITKPYKIYNLRLTITRALEFYELEQENARLHQDWQQLTRETSTLLDSTSALRSAKDAGAILDRIVQVVCNDFGHHACAIELIDKNSWELYIKACTGFPEEIKDYRLTIEAEGIVSYVARTGKLTYLPDVTKDERYIAVIPNTRSQLTIPLRVGEEIIGVLNIESAHLEAFSERELIILTSFADKAAAVIQQVYLFDQVSRGKAEWEGTFDAMADAIFIFDRKRRLCRVNRAGSELLESNYDQLLGQFCCALFPEEEKLGCLTKRLFNEGQRVVAKQHIGKLGHLQTFTVDPIRDEKNLILGSVVIVRNEN